MNAGPLQPRRRKKRPVHGLKTVEVSRGKSGYGFTISGQHPCVLSCIINSSPADRVGLRPGDYLMSVNGVDVSKHSHDDVVCMVGTSTGTLTIQVTENYNSSDSSDDEYYHRTKAKYPHRSRRAHRDHGTYNDKMEKLLGEINHRGRHLPDGTSHHPASRPVQKQDSEQFELPKPRSSRPRLHTPVGAENNEIQAEGTSYIEAGASNVFKVPFQKSVSASQVPNAGMHKYSQPKQPFVKTTSHVQMKSLSSGNTIPSRSYPSHVARAHMYDQFSPNSLQQIIYHSLHSETNSAANEAFILNEDDMADDDDDSPVQPEGEEVRIVVGYVGSLEMPANANQPHIRLQSIRNAVRRLRVDQKIHTFVLMVVTPNYGVRLVNSNGKEIAFYPVDRLAFSGVCPDDRRFFGIVTLHRLHTDSETTHSDSDSQENIGSSCHVFRVDQELATHNNHIQKAKAFDIVCTLDTNTQRCQEFPRSTTPVILSISNLVKERSGSDGMEVDMERSQVFSNPNRPVEHARTSSSSSNQSNSDSGVGLCREDDRGLVLELPPPLPARDRPPPPQLPTVKWSGNTMFLTEGPVRQANTGKGAMDKVSSPETDKLTVRAMQSSPSMKGRSSGDGLDGQNAAENLRLGMQKLLQARQRSVTSEQVSSDTESQNSRTEVFMSTSDITERPVSAPFKYLSIEPQTETKLSKGSRHQMLQTSESNLADKLSPRAFGSSAFSPVSSSKPATKKKHSRVMGHGQTKRSPSAPPLPSYHGDDEDSDDDMSGLIKRFQADKILGTTADSVELRKVDISAQLKMRDQERRSVSPVGSPELSPKHGNHGSNTDKWVKGQSGTGKQKSSRRNPLSLSHESLVVLDQDPMQQKLSSANSVNSIVNHVATEPEQGSRVVSWAVSFQRLLNDAIGISVFTEFLKKEHSEENIEFWKVSEEYRAIIDSNFRKLKAAEIYDKYVSLNGSDSVNIDSVIRKEIDGQLDNPSPQMFDRAQQHIFLLMKQDSYSRFLKSDMYKSYMVREMEGLPLVAPGNQEKQGGTDKESKKKGKENEEKKENRRRSLLPWRHKFKNKAKNENDAKNQKSSSKLDNKPDEKLNSLPLTGNAPTTIDTVASKRDQVQVDVPDTIAEEPDQPRFCRVIMPDGSTTVVGTRQGQTINYVLGKLCEKRGLSIASVDVFLLGSEKQLNLNEDISTLGSKEVTIERRVLFRMDLPNKKSIGVKAKPNRHIRDVFRPILHKYGYRIEDIDVHLLGQSDMLCLDDLVSTIDSQRVIVASSTAEFPVKRTPVPGPTTRPPLPNKFTSKYGLLTNLTDRHTNHRSSHDITEITNQIFDSLMLRKSDHLLASHNFDELGILDAEGRVGKVAIAEMEAGMERFPSSENVTRTSQVDSGKKARTKPKVTFALQKNTVKNRHSEGESSSTARPKNADHPDFLRSHTDRRNNDKLPVMPESRDLMSEIDDYIESINENFAAYTRQNASNRSSGETPKSALKVTNQSLPADGNMATSSDDSDTHSDNPPELDLTDTTEKSLRDIGFSYSHNKYLAKSRNFVNQRKVCKDTAPVCVRLSPSVNDHSLHAESRTRNLADQSDMLELAMVNNYLSSPYSSDSSLDRETTSKFVPKHKHRAQHAPSRHTFLHSPTASDSSDSFLSTVDTDGNLAHHSTSVSPLVVDAGCTPKILERHTPGQPVTDEITFV